MQFYVYQHIRLDTNTPFYIGKGKGSRAKLSVALKRNSCAKSYINTTTGAIFLAGIEAANSINMNYSTFRAQVNGQNPNKTNFIKYTGGLL